MEYLDKVLGVKVTYEDVEFKHGVTVLDAAYLIPFKAKAWMDLTDRKAAGEHENIFASFIRHSSQ